MSDLLRNILVLSPHPDDESIGCGGTIASCIAAGDQVTVVFLTSGEKGVEGTPPNETRTIREQEATRACEILGVQHIEFWHEPDGQLLVTVDLIAKVQRLIGRLRPALVFAPHPEDDHVDHKAAADLAIRAVSTLPEPIKGLELWMYEIWAALTDFDQVIDISDVLERKLTAIRAHASQCELMNFAAAAEGLARYRGEMFCWPRGDYAEVFLEWKNPK